MKVEKRGSTGQSSFSLARFRRVEISGGEPQRASMSEQKRSKEVRNKEAKKQEKEIERRADSPESMPAQNGSLPQASASSARELPTFFRRRSVSRQMHKFGFGAGIILLPYPTRMGSFVPESKQSGLDRRTQMVPRPVLQDGFVCSGEQAEDGGDRRTQSVPQLVPPEWVRWFGRQIVDGEVSLRLRERRFRWRPGRCGG